MERYASLLQVLEKVLMERYAALLQVLEKIKKDESTIWKFPYPS